MTCPEHPLNRSWYEAGWRDGALAFGVPLLVVAVCLLVAALAGVEWMP